MWYCITKSCVSHNLVKKSTKISRPCVFGFFSINAPHLCDRMADQVS